MLFVRVLRRFQQFFNHITMVSGCDMELNAHFYSGASLKYHAPDTWHDTTPSHIILTLGRPVLTLPRKSWVPSEEQLVPFLTTFGMSRPGIEPRTSHSLEGTLYLLSYRGWYCYSLKYLMHTKINQFVASALVLLPAQQLHCPLWLGYPLDGSSHDNLGNSVT